MRPDQTQAIMHSAQQLDHYLAKVHARLQQVRITESRGPATVTLDGLGAVQSVEIPGLDEVADCVVAALRAAEERAQRGYDAFIPSER
jgi:DNA-binding protein YbaB